MGRTQDVSHHPSTVSFEQTLVKQERRCGCVGVWVYACDCIKSGFYLEILFWGGNMVDNFKDSKKGHNTPVGAFATSQL